MAEGDLERGRAAYDDRRWAECVAALRAADEAGELQDRDINALAISLYLIGDDAGCDEVMKGGHQVALDRGDWRLAAQVSFWHGFTLFGRGEHARAGAWLSRTRELVGEHHLGGVEASLPGVVEARGLLVGRELRDPNLEVLGRLTVGQVLIQQGRTDEALSCLDEVMLTVSRAVPRPVPGAPQPAEGDGGRPAGRARRGATRHRPARRHGLRQRLVPVRRGPPPARRMARGRGRLPSSRTCRAPTSWGCCSSAGSTPCSPEGPAATRGSSRAASSRGRVRGPDPSGSPASHGLRLVDSVVTCTRPRPPTGG